MKVRCIVETCCFTIGEVYDVISVDSDGDLWTIDDDGDKFFLHPDECEIVDESQG